MARAIGDFSTANPPEGDLFTLDFVNDLVPGDSIASATWAITVLVGVDPSAAACAMGPATIFGTKVTQKAGNFLAGVGYCMICTVVTRLGLVLILWAPLECEAVGC